MSAPRILVLIDLIQDVEVLAPVLRQMRDKARLKVVVSRWLKAEYPRVESVLQDLGLRYSFVRRADIIAGAKPSLRGVSALLTASESSHAAHSAGHALALAAKALGVRTYTVQHGVENVGLMGPEWRERFASDVVFCWFPEGSTPENLAPETRRKLVHVGRPTLGPVRAERPKWDVAVFENLHAPHYTDDHREQFVRGLQQLIQAGLNVVLRPHPAGAWGDGLRDRIQAANLCIVDRAALRSGSGAALDTIAKARRVITTPSTVALDAAVMGKPVALALAGGAAYADLPVLGNEQEWLAFASAVEDSPAFSETFIARHILPGDAASRIVDRITLDVQENA